MWSVVLTNGDLPVYALGLPKFPIIIFSLPKHYFVLSSRSAGTLFSVCFLLPKRCSSSSLLERCFGSLGSSQAPLEDRPYHGGDHVMELPTLLAVRL